MRPCQPAGQAAQHSSSRRAPRSAYIAAQAPRLDADPAAVRHRCRALGWAGVIAFPHLFAASFAEYGSPEVSCSSGLRGVCSLHCVRVYPGICRPCSRYPGATGLAFCSLGPPHLRSTRPPRPAVASVGGRLQAAGHPCASLPCAVAVAHRLMEIGGARRSKEETQTTAQINMGVVSGRWQ
jgi:hypothetical protein